ncbi:MAG: lactate racemase domain-containing protein [Roseiflexaceae bacterium]
METTTDPTVIGAGSPAVDLSEDETRELLRAAFERWDLSGRRVLVIVPDGTRTAPIPLFFRLLHELLGGRVAALDYLVALGTHPAMSEEALGRLVGVTAAERAARYPDVRIFNHRWDLPETFVTLGSITAAETRALSDGMLSLDVPVRANRLLFEYDQILICGPVFPHEVAGFSGGSKYFFPGVSGPEVINFSHWLGALITSYAIIGVKHTPVRAAIERAAALIDRPKLALCMVGRKDGLAGLYIGAPEAAWSRAADLSAQVHVRYVERPYRQVLSVMPALYDDLWTGAKGMYKVEPAVADGGEVIIYAPGITEVSYTHGQVIDRVGYHVRDYFVKQWERFKGEPWGVLAHSTHLRGMGTYENGIERPRVQVTLATGIPPERCARLGLGYRDPATIRVEEWANREDEGVLLVPYAGETLYRLREA